jgi:ABC-type molybdate transport system substrate-binding protein
MSQGWWRFDIGRTRMGFWNRCLAAVIGIAMVLEAAAAHAAELRVFSDGPLQTSMVKIAAAFQSETKHEVHVIYGTAPALKRTS